MADSQKLGILKALTAFLAPVEVQSKDGIVTLQDRIFRGRAIFSDTDPVPMVSILEAPQGSFSTYAGDYEARKDAWLLLMQGWCDDDPVNPSDPVYGMLDAIEKRMHLIMARGQQNGQPVDRPNYRLGDRIASLTFGPGVVRPPVAGLSSKAFFYLPMTVTLASDDR